MRLLIDVSAVPERPVGAGVYTRELVRELSAEANDDLDLHLLSRRGDAERWRALAPMSTVHPATPDGRAARLAWEQARGASLAEKLGIDVWHGPHYTFPARIAKDTGVVVTIHDMTFLDYPQSHERSKVAYFSRMLRAGAKRAQVLVVPSKVTADRLGELLSPRGEIMVAHHGANFERFIPAATQGVSAQADLALLRRIGVQPPYLAFVGTIEPRKDIPTLVRAFARLGATRPDLRLVLAGPPGWGSDAARQAVAASGAASRVIKTGWLDDAAIPALLRRCEAVVYPSLAEGFGLPALEALACGAPLVTTSGTAMHEVAGDAAVVVTPGDWLGLATAIERILDAPALSDRLRSAGPARAGSFTWQASASTHLAAYRIAAGVRP